MQHACHPQIGTGPAPQQGSGAWHPPLILQIADAQLSSSPCPNIIGHASSGLLLEFSLALCLALAMSSGKTLGLERCGEKNYVCAC